MKALIQRLVAASTLLLCLPCPVFAADYPQHVTFQDVTEGIDVALGEVEAFLQDHEGFMWLGGRNALLRYDGYEFRPIEVQMDAADPSTLTPVNQVVDLFEDSEKNLWVTTRSSLLRYDRDREVLVSLTAGNGEDVLIYHQAASRMAQAPTGELLVGSYNSLYVIDQKTLNATFLPVDPNDPTTLPNLIVHDVFVDKQNNVWVGTEEGLSRLDWSTRTSTNFTPNPAHAGSLHHNGVWAIDQDQEGQLWLGTYKGVYRFNPETGVFRQYAHDPNDRHSLGDDIVRDVFVDHNGWVWIGGDSGGVSLYDRQQDRFIRIQSQAGKPGTLVSNSTRRIYEDRTGDLWIGTYPGGVNFHDRSSTAITHYRYDPAVVDTVLNNEVGAVLEDKHGNLWLGSGGVTKIDRHTNSFKHYRPDPSGKTGIGSSAIISGLIDSDGDIWFGTWASGFFRYNAAADRFDQIAMDATLAKSGVKSARALNDNVVWHIYEDRRKNLWVATHNGGLSRYDKRTGVFTIYEQDLADLTSIANQLVWTMLEDSEGRFWVGTASALNLMDRDTGKFKLYAADGKPGSLVNGSVLAIFEDSKRRVWFGTDAGLHLYHSESDSFTVYNTEHGFADQGIRSINEDQQGNLWLGTNNGVVMFNADTAEVKNYKTHNGGNIGGFFTGSGLTSQRGEVILGASKSGLWIIDVNRLGGNPLPPPVVVTDFRIFTKPVPVNGPEKILSKVINQTDQLVLDYKKSMISFSFAALNFREPEKNQYAYKLEGFDDDWRAVGNQRTALYTNLDPGNYTFRVRASNNDGVWNESGKSIRLRQLPPPWRTWWAHTLYGLFALGVVVQFIRGQRKKRRLVEEQNRILEQRVSERTAELREKNNDIQAMLSNMRQGLFTVEPSGQIHPEYSRHLEAIFNRNALAGHSAYDLLFHGAKLGGDTLDQAKEAIGSIIGEDEMNFDFNAHLLPTEYETEIAGEARHLALDWNPILVDGTVSKLMVSVRDVTELKQMESDAKAKKRELDIISQLLNVSARKYQAFVESAQKFLAENRKFIRVHSDKDPRAVALLFRNMHTIKGNCRTFGFNYISDAAHAAESVYSLLKEDDSVWQQDVMLADLDAVDAALNEYQRVYSDVLGRGKNSGAARDQNGFWADERTLQSIRACIEAVEARFPAVGETQQLRPVHRLLNKALSSPLSAILADVVESLPSIAAQLEKAPPRVDIDDGRVCIRNSAQELMNNVFAHILRNCVDHGIEMPAVRQAKGKAQEGRIEIVASAGTQGLVIRIRDDGQGLNLSRLYKKGMETKCWLQDTPPASHDVAQWIFASGLSTKEQVTDISGRGVGMDAVKQFLRANGGDIQIALLGEVPEKVDPEGQAFVRFELVINLPEDFYWVDEGDTSTPAKPGQARLGTA